MANPRRLLSEPTFKAFVSPIVDERGALNEGQDLEAVIMEVRFLINSSGLLRVARNAPCDDVARTCSYRNIIGSGDVQRL